VLVLAVFSFNSGRYASRFEGASLVWYERLLHPEGSGDRAAAGLSDALATSLRIATGAGVVAVVLGATLALGLRAARRRVASPLLFLWSLPLLLPDVVLGVSWRGAFHALALPPGVLAVGLAHATIAGAFALVVVRARLSTLDPACVEAARDLGAGPLRATWHVVLPHLLPALVGAFLLAFALSFDDFLVTLFVAGGDEPTLPLRVYGMTRRGASPVLHALATLSLVGTLLLGALALRVAFPRSRPPTTGPAAR
jgi:spermidine/putrescine transport system permease protein